MNKYVEHINSTVWAKLGVSKIHGIGVIAIRDIPKGTKIESKTSRSTPIALKDEDFLEILPEIRTLILDRRLMDPGLLLFFSPNDDYCLQSFMNHSETPNSDGNITTREIKKGEEITENYRELDSFKDLHEFSKNHIKDIIENV